MKKITRWGQRKWALTQLNRSLQREKLMPLQLQCEICGCRPFYLMAQDDGSIESFCANANHRKILVNIPELVSHIAKGYDDDILFYKTLLNMIYGRFGKVLDGETRAAIGTALGEERGPKDVEVQDKGSADSSSLQHGTSPHSDMQDVGGGPTRSGLHSGASGEERQQAKRNQGRRPRKRGNRSSDR